MPPTSLWRWIPPVDGGGRRHIRSEKTITRIDAARQAVHDVTAAYPDASFAALRFGASGTLDVPLTPDAPAIDNWPTRWRWKPHPCRRAPVWMLRSINCC